MRIIAISNQKGGVGKTTTSVNLAACLAERGKRVLLVDLDSQGNTTSWLGLAKEEGGSLYSALVDGTPAWDAVRSTRLENLFIIRSHRELAGAEIELAQRGQHLTRMRDVLAELRPCPVFDLILLDCPPSLGVIMTSALAAADELLVPIQCEYLALEGFSDFLQIIQQVIASGANPGLLLGGVLMTMFDGRNSLSQQVVNDVRAYVGQHFPGDVMYQTVIPRTVRLAETPSFGKTILEYDPNGKGAEAYRALAEEFLQRQPPQVAAS
ncbi:MAG: ParA family protein [Prosthecobacter sp.]|uniref:ParA family protein n=1 Tax=Prosthecobacter sp. TaxID=1965333 RepID=UPI003902C3EF